MEINEYQEKVKRTMANLGTLGADNIHMILGILTEAGELADVFKKNLAYRKEIDWVNVKEEIGDSMFYIAGLCNNNKFNLGEILDRNIEKLKARYPEKFTEDNANNRDLEKERKTLE